eukprot:CAMPEP_0170558142 /NCGR_PEP_ID=MMETSP0211-20121228/33033_1 /TAXON_ID=311385 /ORGANISM="Pseudokeronopsis sp., Strain OXSARD2" /LENGTH=68 /DNA_ID=CAMNT_0010869789 /DNA_START=143 /DNA_END=349 /DNA_ORIENTATION=-
MTLSVRFPDRYEYHLVKDKGTTGRFEVSLLKNYKKHGTALLVHSKKDGDGFPSTNMDSLYQKLEEVHA